MEKGTLSSLAAARVSVREELTSDEPVSLSADGRGQELEKEPPWTGQKGWRPSGPGGCFGPAPRAQGTAPGGLGAFCASL